MKKPPNKPNPIPEATRNNKNIKVPIIKDNSAIRLLDLIKLSDTMSLFYTCCQRSPARSRLQKTRKLFGSIKLVKVIIVQSSVKRCANGF